MIDDLAEELAAAVVGRPGWTVEGRHVVYALVTVPSRVHQEVYAAVLVDELAGGGGDRGGAGRRRRCTPGGTGRRGGRAFAECSGCQPGSG